MDKYLHFAVNILAEDEAEPLLTVDGETISLDVLGEHSWYGSYKMTESGTHKAELSYGDKKTERYFSVGTGDKNGGSVVSPDLLAELTFSKGCFEQNVQ